MELAGGYTAKDQSKVKHLHGGRIGLDSETHLVIKLPDSKVLRIISRSVFLGLVILTLPCIGSLLRGVSVSELKYDTQSENFNFEQLGELFHDLAGEGLRRKSDKALIVSPVNVGMIHNLHPFDYNVFDIVMDSDLERKSSFLDESWDFVFAFNLVDAKFVDRILKIGGIVAVPLSNDPSNAFKPKPNYKIVYLRRYASTFVAMRKTSPSYDLAVKSRRLCQFETKAKKTVVKGLEDVVLEPPRRVLAKSNEYLKKIKFLPNLMGDSLQVYNLVVEPEEASSTVVALPRNDLSDWLKENVREEDYVVMKAEAEMVVEMIKKKTICLVDELFLECNNGWWQKNGKTYGSKRACLLGMHCFVWKGEGSRSCCTPVVSLRKIN
ncbi:PREDICTED: unnamed product [Prunus dulcis]|uniref:PREDICTED: unnamed product n=1 Tax=Prunus dulcis TaxID=3755 RepID=A0A5E4FQ80_PRUDU|nr:PREDICTED: unnamed product [Prunus dulcis]